MQRAQSTGNRSNYVNGPDLLYQVGAYYLASSPSSSWPQDGLYQSTFITIFDENIF